MAQVNTVKGSIDTASLAVTLMHEHIFVLSPDINQRDTQEKLCFRRTLPATMTGFRRNHWRRWRQLAFSAYPE
jgi:predicted metal-dependent phosphotriesterase family hydrolase